MCEKKINFLHFTLFRGGGGGPAQRGESSHFFFFISNENLPCHGIPVPTGSLRRRAGKVAGKLCHHQIHFWYLWPYKYCSMSVESIASQRERCSRDQLGVYRQTDETTLSWGHLTSGFPLSKVCSIGFWFHLCPPLQFYWKNQKGSLLP